MIVIPMAGLSSRFFKAGYTEPKYMLPAHGKSLFEHALLSFNQYFQTHTFLFIVRDIYSTPLFVEQRCNILGIKDYIIVILKEETRGQAETAYLGLREISGDIPVTIFNIDTFRPNFTFPQITNRCDGYLEVFKGSGDNWSYAKPLSKNSDIVIETAEKKPISNLCSTGLYHFNKLNDFNFAFKLEITKPTSEWQKKELYIAPLYNTLIKSGKDIRFNLIEKEQVIFCGIPHEYLDFLKSKEI